MKFHLLAPAFLLAALAAASPVETEDLAKRCACNKFCILGDICVVVPGPPCESICVKPVACGGIAGLPCPKGERCIDDPRDTCDPRKGGADCIGICIPNKTLA